MPRVAPVWKVMSDVDRICIEALARCSFLPASFDKRFARDLDERRSMAQQISLGQRASLFALVWKYRRQIAPTIVAKAALHLAEAQAEWQLAKDEARVVSLRPRRAADRPTYQGA